MSWLRRPKKRHDYEVEFVAQVHSHWEGLYRYALRLTGSPATAEDLVQEALTKGFSAYERLREGTNHRAWIFTILRNTFLTRARKQGREVLVDDHEQLAATDPALAEVRLWQGRDGWRHGFEDEVLGALEALPESQRTAVVLCDIEGFTYDEIAEVLGCPLGTVRSRIHHARRRLRAGLADYAQARGYVA